MMQHMAARAVVTLLWIAAAVLGLMADWWSPSAAAALAVVPGLVWLVIDARERRR
jgi:hypothetical protein